MAKTKTRVKTKPVVSDKVMTINEPNALAEQLVQYNDSYQKAKKVVTEYDGIKRKLQGYIPKDADTSEPYRFEGVSGDVEFSACAMQRKVTALRELHEKLGDDVFYAIATVTLKDVDKYLTEIEQNGIVEKSQTGPRKFSLKPKSA